MGLRVSIDVTYNSPLDLNYPTPPYYRPSTKVTLTCRAADTVGSVTYRWSSTCSSCFASRSSAQSISKSILTASDAGVHTCTATDSDGNTGSNSTEMQLIGMLLSCMHNSVYDMLYRPMFSHAVSNSMCN